ncbi:astacin-like metalloprotease toxin 5 [Centruroides vittatus]|uniref:astacin-like metalloprotease toxin 5 n=1 Tax=Centruroides vittatus TaxID=120091 RepID=UPI0035104F74
MFSNTMIAILINCIFTIQILKAEFYGDLPMQNPDLFEGDILGIEDPNDRGALSDERLRWPNGIIYYTIDHALRFHVSRIELVMKEYEKNTCLRFVKRTDEEDYIKFFVGEGCYSHVGKTGGAQPLSLGNFCTFHGTVTHEIGHAIGFLHEQNRSDRDDYINIYWENIQEGMEDQFTKFLPTQNLLINEFDYNSIMLYGEKTFSKDRKKLKTMTAKKEGIILREVVDKMRPSASDYYRINKLYNCKEFLKDE